MNSNKLKVLIIPNVATSKVNLRDAEASLRRRTTFGIKENKKDLSWTRAVQGLLLFEVMLTIIILSVGLTLILRSFSISLNAIKSAQYYTTAALLIEDKMWELEQEGSVTADLNEEGQFPEPYQKFNWRLETKDKAIQGQSDKLNELKLTVFWQEGKRKGSVSAVTCLPNKTQ